MKTKEQLKQELSTQRREYLQAKEKEFEEYKKLVDFEGIFSAIESQLEENYIIKGEVYSFVDLTELLPQEFKFETISEKEADYKIRNIIIDDLQKTGYSVRVSGLKLEIS